MSSAVTQMSLILVRALITAIPGSNVTSSHFLAQMGLKPGQLNDVHERVEIAHYRLIVQAALEASGDPAFGLHLGERLTLGSFDVIGHLTEHSDTLRDAIQVGVRYGRIVTDRAGLELHEHGNTALLRLSLPDPESVESRVGAEFATTAILRLIRAFVGPDALPRRFYFAYRAPSHQAEYERLLEGRQQFEHEFTGIEIDRSWLDAASPCPQPDLRSFLLTRADFLLAKLDRSVSATERVQRWLAANASNAQPRMAAIAHDLGTSIRALRRSLREEQTNFSELIDAMRIRQAMSLLADPKRSIGEVATALGFATPSAFSRAFKRWTGAPPRAHRSGSVL